MVAIARSEMNGNTWYIFRENGDEVEVAIVNDKMNPSKRLTPEEANYIRENILNTWKD